MVYLYPRPEVRTSSPYVPLSEVIANLALGELRGVGSSPIQYQYQLGFDWNDWKEMERDGKLLESCPTDPKFDRQVYSPQQLDLIAISFISSQLNHVTTPDESEKLDVLCSCSSEFLHMLPTSTNREISSHHTLSTTSL